MITFFEELLARSRIENPRSRPAYRGAEFPPALAPVRQLRRFLVIFKKNMVDSDQSEAIR
jgi:hypothetical protein